MQLPETNLYILKDGRTLAYCEYGDMAGHPIFYAHGGPSSRYEAMLFHEAAKSFGFHIIATDRPGMGESTFMEGRVLLDYAQDIRELADSLGLEKFGVMGWSGGGAHTVICGYALVDRLTFNISLCGYTHFTELPGAVDLLRAPADRMAVRWSQEHPFLFRLLFEAMNIGFKIAPNLTLNELLKTLNEPDKEIFNQPDFKEAFIIDQKEAFRQGGKGVAVDAAVHYVDWGFRLRDIPGKVHIFHGTEDMLVPFAYAQHLSDNIPNAQLHTLKGHGHLFPVNHQELIFSTAQAELEKR